MSKNPFHLTTNVPHAVVIFSYWRPSHRTASKKAAESFFTHIYGSALARKILKQGYFYVDSTADALLCKQEMESLKDMAVSQFVFQVSVFERPQDSNT